MPCIYTVATSFCAFLVSGFVPTSPAKGTSSTPVPKRPKSPTDRPHRGGAAVKYVLFKTTTALENYKYSRTIKFIY